MVGGHRMKLSESKHFILEEVDSGIFAAVAKPGGGAIGNAGFVDLGGQTLIFDTFNTPQAAEDLKAYARTLTQNDQFIVINSHWHGDHIRGNQVFKNSPIISSHITYEKMKTLHPNRIQKQKEGMKGLDDYIASLQTELDKEESLELLHQIGTLSEIRTSLLSLELHLPQLTFEKNIHFYGAKRQAKLFTMGSAHSSCDSMLYLPDDHVLFSGDVVFVQSHPSLFEESDPTNWKVILSELKEWDIQKVIPGHGPVDSKVAIQHVMAYMNHLEEVAQLTEDQSIIPEIFISWEHPEIYRKNIQLLKERSMK